MAASPEDIEREPLLTRTEEQKRRRQSTPLPKLQLGVILLLLAAERISVQIIVPFINELVRNLDITGGDPKKVGYYVGMVGSLFYAAQATSVFAWSRTSDRIGRKPILLAGLGGICISLTCFGFSKTFVGLVVSRCATGLLNGNASVIKSFIGDITDSTNRPTAFAFNEILWATGGTIGSFMGGILARPADRFPTVFDSTFWRSYPYLLSCLSAVFFAAFCFVIAFIYLQETIQTSRHSVFDNALPSSPVPSEDDKPPSVRSLMTPPVALSVTIYCVAAFTDVCLFPLFPLFYATPIDIGGLGFDPFKIAVCLSAYGVINSVIEILFFARIIARFGPKSLIIASTVIYPFVMALFPLMNLLSRKNGVSPGVWALLGFQLLLTVGFDMSFGAIFLFVTASAPNKRSLGSVNGMAYTLVSISRIFGPATSESLFALSLERNWLGGNAVYLILSLLPLFTFFFASRLPHRPWVHSN